MRDAFIHRIMVCCGLVAIVAAGFAVAPADATTTPSHVVVASGSNPRTHCC
jgi:hypothetical protein